jgi:hypothetical protein
LTLRSSTPCRFQKRITTTLCESSAALTRVGRPGPLGPVCERFSGVTLSAPVLGSFALADEPGFAVGDSAAGGVWLGAGVVAGVSLGLCVTKNTAPRSTTPTTPKSTGLGRVAMLTRSKGSSLPLPPFG